MLIRDDQKRRHPELIDRKIADDYQDNRRVSQKKTTRASTLPPLFAPDLRDSTAMHRTSDCRPRTAHRPNHHATLSSL
jgi:hypothetical protein